MLRLALPALEAELCGTLGAQACRFFRSALVTESEPSGPNADAIAPRQSRTDTQLVVVSGEELRVFDLPREGSRTIGRAEGNQIRIDHPSVSRWHAVLEFGASIAIEDLGGSNGTFIREATSRALAGQSQPTQSLKRLLRARAELGIGDNLLIGAVSAVLRQRPSAPSVFPNGKTRAARPDLIVLDANMTALYEQAERAAQALISVLLLGETGVGKEVLARAIHGHSPRAKHAFMAINCAALGEQVLEGELFGYERGAFTGAVQARPGLFEAADGGTVLLDEVGELPLSTQAKLLRVLEERTVMRIGARATRAIDVRFLAATNRDLEAQVRAGAFRQDLFYRLNGISLTIPPLRARPLELEPLARSFLATACAALGRGVLELSAQAMRALKGHAWPGNVRELRNVIERAVVLCAEDCILPEHLPASLTGTPAQASAPAALSNREAALDAGEFQAQIAAMERERIVDALHRCGGNQTQTAKLLGISRSTLILQLEAFGLPRPRKRKR